MGHFALPHRHALFLLRRYKKSLYQLPRALTTFLLSTRVSVSTTVSSGHNPSTIINYHGRYAILSYLLHCWRQTRSLLLTFAGKKRTSEDAGVTTRGNAKSARTKDGDTSPAKEAKESPKSKGKKNGGPKVRKSLSVSSPTVASSPSD